MKVLGLLFLTFAAAERSKDHLKVTCGSAIKLTHVNTGFKLHSHDVKYGSGSGQQSVTAFPQADDPNSYFVVHNGVSESCPRGAAMECNKYVRLKHLQTQKYLHSHLHFSPLSNQQEVSCFDQASNAGDEWKLLCVSSDSKNNGTWQRDSQVRLQHRETGMFLHASKSFMYRQPIPGQLEMSAVKSASADTLWAAQEGVYYSDNEVLG